MEPKEKAKELVRKYWDLGGIDVSKAKQCALKAVNEILNIYQIKNATFEFYEVRNYWQEVKTEIELL